MRVNNIATEHVLTDRIRDIADSIWRRDGETIERIRRDVPLRRYGTAQELANAVVFLCTDAASYITGVALCGGRRHGPRVVLTTNHLSALG